MSMARQGGKKSSTSTAADSMPRQRALTKRQKRAKAKTESRTLATPLNSFRLSLQVFKVLSRFWKPLGGILLVYLLLNILFASGISSLNSTVASIKSDLNNSGVQAHPLLAGTTGFLVLATSAGTSSSSTGSILQVILIIVESLAIIWALRHLMAGKPIGIKQAYYNASAPLIPFLLVLAIIFVQLLPLSIGAIVISAIVSSLGSVGALWTILFAAILVLLAVWSLYMLSASVLGLYIVTLPDMKPLTAIRSAKNLVRFRRWLVIRRVLFLPVLILVVLGAVIIPLILYATSLVAPVYFVLGALALLFAHSYLYSLYRELLG